MTDVILFNFLLYKMTVFQPLKNVKITELVKGMTCLRSLNDRTDLVLAR